MTQNLTLNRLISVTNVNFLKFWGYSNLLLQCNHKFGPIFCSVMWREHTHPTITYTLKQVMSSHACNYDLLYLSILELQINTINHIIKKATLISWNLQNIHKTFSWCNIYCKYWLNNVANKLLHYLSKRTHLRSSTYLHMLVFGVDFTY